MGGILAFLLVGIVGLAYWYGVMPETETTVLSQLAMNILGHNAGYYFVQATTVMILVLAANTGFTAFPMLAASMAKDKYMPRMFSVRGSLRLFELYHHFRCWGYLAYYHFDGKTENLIPLYLWVYLFHSH